MGQYVLKNKYIGLRKERKCVQAVIERNKTLKKQNKVLKKTVKETKKSCKNKIYTESLDYVYYCVFFGFLTINELTAEKHLIVKAAKLNQHESILTSKFGSKDMLLQKRGSVFVSTEDEEVVDSFHPNMI